MSEVKAECKRKTVELLRISEEFIARIGFVSNWRFHLIWYPTYDGLSVECETGPMSRAAALRMAIEYLRVQLREEERKADA